SRSTTGPESCDAGGWSASRAAEPSGRRTRQSTSRSARASVVAMNRPLLQLFIVIAVLVTVRVESRAQSEIGGWHVQGGVHRRGAKRGPDDIDSTLAIFDDGTYVSAAFLACDREFYCEPGTWRRAARGRLILTPAFPAEYDPPQQLILARCLFGNSF